MADKQEELKKTTEEFMELLRTIAPLLWNIELLNSKFLKDMDYGEIHIVEHVRGGKVYRLEVQPKISKMIDNA